MLLLGGGVEGNDGEATVEMVLLWNTTEDELCYIHDLSQREVRREREREMSTTLVYKWQIATYYLPSKKA